MKPETKPCKHACKKEHKTYFDVCDRFAGGTSDRWSSVRIHQEQFAIATLHLTNLVSYVYTQRKTSINQQREGYFHQLRRNY